MASASHGSNRNRTDSCVFTAPFAATRRIAMRTVALATVLATALLWLAVLALAASTAAAPMTSTAASTASAFSLRGLVAWLHDPNDSHVSSSTPSIRRAGTDTQTLRAH